MIAQVSMLGIMSIGAYLIRHTIDNPRHTGRPRFLTSPWILALALLSVGMLVTSDAFSGVWAPLLNYPVGSLMSWSTALFWVFILDIVVQTILVVGTGGGRDSPFQPIYFLLPTLAIFLHEPDGRVVTYLALVAVSFSISMAYMSPISMVQAMEMDRDEEFRWRRAYWFVSLASFVLATSIGLMTRQQ